MITLTGGHIQNQGGMAVPNGSISFQLNLDATVLGAPGGLIPSSQVVIFQFDSSGDLVQPAQIYSNAELTPQNASGLGTFYLVSVYDANGAPLNASPMRWQFTQPANATVDISQMTPFFSGGNVIFYALPGTVTSVGLTDETNIFSVSGSPITTAGSIALNFANEAANTVLAGPISGGSGLPTFRKLVTADLPGGGGGSPGGANGTLQFNSSGAFGGASGSAVTSDGTVTLAPTGTDGTAALTIVAENAGGAEALALYSNSAAKGFGVIFQDNGSNGHSIRMILTDADGDQSSLDANGFGFSNGAGGMVTFGQNNVLSATTPLSIFGSTSSVAITQWFPNGQIVPSILIKAAGSLNLGAAYWTFATLPSGSATVGDLVFCPDAMGPQDSVVWGSTAVGSGTGAVLRFSGSNWLVVG